MRTYFILDKFKPHCQKLNKKQSISSSSFNQQGNDQAQTYIKFIKRTKNKCTENNKKTYLALLLIRSTLTRPGLPCPETILFNQPVKGILLRIVRSPLFNDYDEDYCNILKARQDKIIKNKGTPKEHTCIPIGSTLAVQRGQWAVDQWHSNKP